MSNEQGKEGVKVLGTRKQGGARWGGRRSQVVVSRTIAMVLSLVMALAVVALDAASSVSGGEGSCETRTTAIPVAEDSACGTAPQRSHYSQSDIDATQYCLETFSEYNDTYPITPPHYQDHYTAYRVALVSDQDHASKKAEGIEWQSTMYTGELWQHSNGSYSFHQDREPTVLSTFFSAKGRGAELSELHVFNGKLFAADDRTGIIFEVLGHRLIPRFILADGSGDLEKGFKIEWMTVKDKHLWVGGIGRNWTTTSGTFMNSDPKWVKVVSPAGAVRHIDWRRAYDALHYTMDLPDAGYLWHEAVAWCHESQRWIFLPRRESIHKYDEAEDERRGTNLLLTADVTFTDITTRRIGDCADPERGFSSFKIVPDTGGRHLLAVKSREVEGQLESFVTVVDAKTGAVLLEDQKVADDKLEGIEFV